ncbi:hypothetical protein CEE45_04760 [Candidatus Heimdallarchaeota archaeon B3_Heim]|nr:MAG: hypothetical protein CEE45_04760 [Candidatus Heimdallarchaeota archaeon B3_Heim]
MDKIQLRAFYEEYEAIDANNYSQIFDLIRRIASTVLKKSRAGILIGLEDLGFHPQGFVGGYHRVGTNEIYLNRNVLQIMREETPKGHYKAYLFHLLLHEYIHSIGYTEEEDTQKMTRFISRTIFGTRHPVFKIAAYGLNALFPHEFYEGHFEPDDHLPRNIEFIQLHHHDSRLTYM